jgi:hypothetical protein
MKFTLDTTLPAVLNVASADAAAGHRFAEAVFASGGVAAIYRVNDFVTVTPPARLRLGSDRRGSRTRPVATDRSIAPDQHGRHYAQRQQHHNGRLQHRHSRRRRLSPEQHLRNRLAQRCRPAAGNEQVVANRSDRGDHARCGGRVRRRDEGLLGLGAVGASRFGAGRGGSHRRGPRSARTRTATGGLVRDPAASECRG